MSGLCHPPSQQSVKRFADSAGSPKQPPHHRVLRLLHLPDEVQEWVELGDLQAGHARAILSAEDPLSLAKVVRKKGLSVRQAEQLAKDRPGKARGQTGRDSSPDTESLERALTTVFGMKVSIKGSGQRGEVRIRYSNPAELRKIEAKVRGQW